MSKRSVLMTVGAVALFVAGLFGTFALINQVSSPAPVDAPTHVGQPGQWQTPTVHQATEQALRTGGCHNPWNGAQIPCPGNYAIYFAPSDELWVRYINAFVGHGWAGNWGGCEQVPAIASACQYWLTVDPAWFDFVFTARPGGVAVIWNDPSGALVGFWG